jgi:hypothetical protein
MPRSYAWHAAARSAASSLCSAAPSSPAPTRRRELASASRLPTGRLEEALDRAEAADLLTALDEEEDDAVGNEALST